jgi:hypothetical protein
MTWPAHSPTLAVILNGVKNPRIHYDGLASFLRQHERMRGFFAFGSE